MVAIFLILTVWYVLIQWSETMEIGLQKNSYAIPDHEYLSQGNNCAIQIAKRILEIENHTIDKKVINALF